MSRMRMRLAEYVRRSVKFTPVCRYIILVRRYYISKNSSISQLILFKKRHYLFRMRMRLAPYSRRSRESF